MLDRFERALKIICVAMAALLVWEAANLILRGDRWRISPFRLCPPCRKRPTKLPRLARRRRTRPRRTGRAQMGLGPPTR